MPVKRARTPDRRSARSPGVAESLLYTEFGTAAADAEQEESADGGGGIAVPSQQESGARGTVGGAEGLVERGAASVKQESLTRGGGQRRDDRAGGPKRGASKTPTGAAGIGGISGESGVPPLVPTAGEQRVSGANSADSQLLTASGAGILRAPSPSAA